MASSEQYEDLRLATLKLARAVVHIYGVLTPLVLKQELTSEEWKAISETHDEILKEVDAALDAISRTNVDV